MNWFVKTWLPMDWLIKQMLNYVVVPVLKKSGKGWKAALGVLLIALGYLVEQMVGSPMVPVLQKVMEVIQPYASIITDGGVVALVLGVMDKLYKMMPQGD